MPVAHNGERVNGGGVLYVVCVFPAPHSPLGFDKKKWYTIIMESNILSKLSDYLFWDCDSSRLDPFIDRSLIIERVFSRGTENDEKEIFAYYDRELIKNSILGIKYLDKKTLNYLSIVFNVPKEEFRCYKQSLLESPFGMC
jgi:hypothetical protein